MLGYLFGSIKEDSLIAFSLVSSALEVDGTA